jgi:penicillin amidase
MQQTPHRDPEPVDGTSPSEAPRGRRFVRRALVALGVVLCAAILLLAAGALWVRHQVVRSLPQVEGDVAVAGVTAVVEIERDARGVPTLRARDRIDLAFATGFVHGQDRFFQMDLLRRASAGELAELFGPMVVVRDRRMRAHRFRAMASRLFEESDPGRRTVVDAYAEGVNAGLESLDGPPFEYLLLGVEPVPWRPEDSTLVSLTMHVDLQDELGAIESSMGTMYDLLPAELVEFLTPTGTEWDAPVDGTEIEMPPIPGPEVYDLRKQRSRRGKIIVEHEGNELALTGSNNWAVSGDLTGHGGAILANDIHLGHQVPNIWYRASFVWPDPDDPSTTWEVHGITLPGTPAMISGSNGHVAWGFTNSEGDWTDLIILETDPDDEEIYLTPDGPRSFDGFEETVRVKGAEDETVDVRWTIWGPVIDHDHWGRLRALSWVAHHPRAVNLELMNLERARTVDEALEIANRSGVPAQNFVVADRDGRVGWTIAGVIPRRVGFDGKVPTSWADGSHRWDGWLESDEMPRIVQPNDGRIWTANARVVGGEMLEKIRNRYTLGARAKQIRDRLYEKEEFTERDLLAIQLDDRAVFLERWRELLLSILTPDFVAADPKRAEFRRLVEEEWTGHASIDSVGFRMTRAFRSFLSQEIRDSLTTVCQEADERFRYAGQWEGPLWAILSERPQHLLDPSYASWGDRLAEVVDRTIHYYTEDGSSLSSKTWGDRNTIKVRHPISAAVPLLSRWIDMPTLELPGDSYMPRVQGQSAGASERLIVSPGREEHAIFHMPTGQSGHPLSPHYADGHTDWAEGNPSPLLPGPPIHTLHLNPK